MQQLKNLFAEGGGRIPRWAPSAFPPLPSRVKQSQTSKKLLGLLLNCYSTSRYDQKNTLYHSDCLLLFQPGTRTKIFFNERKVCRRHRWQAISNKGNQPRQLARA